ncbi:MAG: cyanoexosortase B system-associated protein [Leptolyngbya sp. SIO4C1]|nr:cyanoexosortase B system-associated protein [Leptolyngbya sp. SIO4C1]
MTSNSQPVSAPSTRPAQRPLKLLLIVLLTALVAIAALPSYLSGQWPWHSAPDVPQMEALLALREEGLAVPGWQQELHKSVSFGGDRWLFQQISSQQPSDYGQAVLLMRSQAQAADQPEVEWLDLNGAQQWQIDTPRQIKLQSAHSDRHSFTARYFRARQQNETYAANYAVLQWYAWPGGGHTSPSRWFWADQRTQWQSYQRLPWVAVSLLLPIAPLGETDSHVTAITQLGQTVENALQNSVFSPTPAP